MVTKSAGAGSGVSGYVADVMAEGVAKNLAVNLHM